MRHPTVTARVAVEEVVAVRAAVEDGLRRYFDELATLVNIDCGSYTKAGLDAVAGWMAAALAALGAQVERRPDPTGRLGDTVVATFERRAAGPRALLIGHMDTVFEPGTAAARPFRIEDGRAYGPGVTDMKSGLLAGLHALSALRVIAADGAGRATTPDRRRQGRSLPVIGPPGLRQGRRDICSSVRCCESHAQW